MTTHGRRWADWALLVLLLAVPIVASGCGSDEPVAAQPPSNARDSAAPAAAKLTAQQVLQRLNEAYRAAESYEDAGKIYFSFVEGNQEYVEEPVPFSLSLQRPNKLRLQMFFAALVSDGEKLRAAVKDMPGQVLEVAAPQELTAASLPQSEILDHALNGGLAPISAPQLELLLGGGIAAPAGTQPKLLEDAETDGQRCYRVALATPDGEKVLWVDQQSFTLRRVDLPTRKLRELLDAQERITSMNAWIDLNGARLDTEVKDSVFQFEVPDEAVRVQYFVPPVSAPPTRVGEVLSGFEFVDLQGKPLRDQDLQGKVRVLEFWFTTCAPCQVSLPELQTLYEKYRDHPQVSFLAVSIDDPQVPDADVEKAIRALGVEVPVARDTKGQGEKVFRLPGAPTLVLLDENNKIHAFQVGLVPGQGVIEQQIEQLLAGEDVAQRVLANYERERQAYEVELQKASADAATQMIEVPRAEIAPRSEPRLLKLTELWRSGDVKEPGNVLVVPQEDAPPRIFVLDGWRAVVELDASGELVKRHELPLPPRTGVSFLRTAVDADGKRYFVAAAVSQQQLHLFDAAWQPILSFPDGKHAGIADVQFGDLGADGALELLVGYWGDVGVQGVSLEGKRLWSNRTMQNVMQVAVSGPDEKRERKLICVNSRGTLVPVDARGEQSPDLRVTRRALTNVAIADLDGDGASEWCTLAADPSQLGKFHAVGVSATGEELWSYSLPDGLHKYLIERIIPGQLAVGDGGWILPAADGSIHVLTKDGQLVDRFNYGSALTGLALAPFPTGPVLLVATPESLVAYRLSRK